jgi:hypothetical protein
MARVVLAVLAVGVTFYAFFDCLRCADDEVRGLPRQGWCLVTLLPVVGGMAWLLYGRARQPIGAAGRPRVIAPDDDPDFLRGLGNPPGVPGHSPDGTRSPDPGRSREDDGEDGAGRPDRSPG